MEAFVAYTFIDNLNQPLPDAALKSLPSIMKDEINLYKMNDDQIRLLAGKRLLYYALQITNHESDMIQQYTVAPNGKPFIPGFHPFNITHSGNIVAIAVLLSRGEIGIDCEMIRPIQPSSFTKQFSPPEMQWILNAQQPQQRFFDAWTMKEAVMKADGRGMRIPLHHIRLKKDYATIDDNPNIWFLYPLSLHPNHPAHLCSDQAISNIKTIHILTNDLWLL
ncbi:MAG: 4'-phosphopantetheinyl transferase superfamily protein [Candidatus Competibacteraceae bacterium]|nr:4'-phosphopantetheinyl transferase superfamily protein [Candidatus Competibacteraceae bacterium]